MAEIASAPQTRLQRRRLSRDELRAGDAFTVMLVPHNREAVFRVRLNYRLAKFLVIISIFLFFLGLGGIALLVLQAKSRNEILTEADIWQTRLRLAEYRRDRILATLHTFDEKGREMFQTIWGEEFGSVRRGKADFMAEEFSRRLAPAREALRFFSIREDALQNMPSGMPMASAFVTSMYGTRISPFGFVSQFHSGIDFANSIGTPILATADGRVVTAVSEGGGYGKHVRLLHKHGLVTLYAHMSALNVEKDQWVKRGDVVGYLGQTGSATGPHLHYEIRLRNPDPFNAFEITLNPWPFIKEQL